MKLVNKSGKYLTDRAGLKRLERAVKMAGTKLEGMDAMIAALGVRAEVAAEDPAAIQRRIIENILSKESVSEILAAGSAGLPSGRDLAGEPLLVNAIQYNTSDFTDNDGALPFYAVVTAVHGTTGEAADFSCGSAAGMAQLFRLDQVGEYPYKVKVTLGRRTAAGNQPYWFEAASF